MARRKKEKWLRVKIKAQEETLNSLIEQLSLMGTTGILETTDGVESYFPYQRRYNSIASIKKFLSSIGEEDALIRYDVIENGDWHLKWQNGFESMRITTRIAVMPAWEKNPPDSEILIRIKPGMAFGTGTHESTQLTLTLMENYVLPGVSVLDAGCGSGILSIAAAMLGASQVDSIDFDEMARENFKENVRLNNLTEMLKFRKKDVTRMDNFGYDIVIANIERNVILKLIKRVLESDTRPVLILSGLLGKDLPLIEKKINGKYGILDQANKGEWIALVLKAK